MLATTFIHDVLNVLRLAEPNTRLVVLTTAALGLAGGVIGTFLLLRKRALVGDVLAHAMLPGIALAFLAMVALGGSGKSLVGLLIGGALFGGVGVLAMWCITQYTRIKDDAALGITLSVLFGLGVALLGMAQATPEGSAAGLQSFIYGKTASMVRSDMYLIGGCAIVIAIACAALFKEFTLLCFDEAYAAAQGLPVRRLDLLMLALVTVVMVIGLQAVGLILMVAMLIIPAAAARFWTDRLPRMVVISAAIGAASGWLGASISALTPKLPAGAMIVLAGSAVFAISLVFGIERGALLRMVRRLSTARRVADQHLLRALYELGETDGDDTHDSPVSHAQLLKRRSWSRFGMKRAVARARRANLVSTSPREQVSLTAEGLNEARAAVRNHRLWELFLITHADLAPSHVDRNADEIEHVLGKDLVAQLERAMEHADGAVLPASPHALGDSA